MQQRTKLIAIVGGSGSGKTWLTRRLEQNLNPMAAHLSLDDFYLDRSSVPARRRERLNYDHPRAIDWARFEAALRTCRDSKPTRVPRYDFTTHTRAASGEAFYPRPVTLVDGLWLLVRPRVRALFDFTVFLDCPVHRRMERRLERDISERGRDPGAVQEQFWRTVAPMHERFVAPQATIADIVIRQPVLDANVENLAATIRALAAENVEGVSNDLAFDWLEINGSRAATGGTVPAIQLQHQLATGG